MKTLLSDGEVVNCQIFVLFIPVPLVSTRFITNSQSTRRKVQSFVWVCGRGQNVKEFFVLWGVEIFDTVPHDIIPDMIISMMTRQLPRIKLSIKCGQSERTNGEKSFTTDSLNYPLPVSFIRRLGTIIFPWSCSKLPDFCLRHPCCHQPRCVSTCLYDWLLHRLACSV